jgi:hypothetical protein
MENSSLAYAKYWRNSLADAELGKGGLKKDELLQLKKRPFDELDNGIVHSDLVDEFFKDENKDTELIEVTLRPRLYVYRLEHGKKREWGVPELLTPVVSQALLDRSGRLYPSAKTLVPRDLLEPLDSGSFSVGSVEELDRFLTEHNAPHFDPAHIKEADGEKHYAEFWGKYTVYWQRMLNDVASRWSTPVDQFETDPCWYILKNDDVTGASRHILALYDSLRGSNPAVALFDRYASEAIIETEACLQANTGFSARLGHANDCFPLADAQRDALTHLLVAQKGEVLGVNGPPGTGKTTMLLSVVASLWAKAALEGGNPPVIFAASTNNQAVTNIIDAFGKDFSEGTGFFAGRWIPGISSFGSYLPSAKREKELAGKYQTRAFFDATESEDFLIKAEAAFLDAAKKAYPHIAKMTVQVAVDALRHDIKTNADKLVAIEQCWNDYQQALQKLKDELGDNPTECLIQRKNIASQTKQTKEQFEALQVSWEGYRAKEPIWYGLFSWIKPVAEKRLRLAMQFLRGEWPLPFPANQWRSLNDIDDVLATQTHSLKTTYEAQLEHIQRGEQVVDLVCIREQAWGTIIAPLFSDRDPKTVSLADCDLLADTQIRFHIFLLTTHYWEGQWLMEVRKLSSSFVDEKAKKGRWYVEKRWRRRLMLTPCAVSTFFMLPSEMKVSRYEKGDFLDDYLYEFVDLLIVDEAGQVLPEVAGASFSLAQKALVIGDTLQLEPIWSIPRNVDIGNLISTGILPKTKYADEFNRLTKLGKTASAGSVMAIAQHLTRYHYDLDLPRGMFLYEHRRCYDDIVSYCNDLCYQGKLRPMRGVGARQNGLPTMGYLQVDGLCEQRGNGSRQNILEAETIAAWIAENRASLESIYAKPIHEILAVVTPFSGQVSAVLRACAAKDIPAGDQENQMTVGTVHALQGAERLIVIFSPVYSKHANGEFIDRSPSMLNVAVSRAKDSFLVFGDMDLFDPMLKGKPRGLLASYLFADTDNALTFSPLPRKDIASKSSLLFLRDAAQHDEFLLKLVESASRELIVVSPWIRKKQLHDTGILAAMAAAVQRGVCVLVYADRWLCINADEQFASDWQALVQILEQSGIQLVNTPLLHSKIVICDANTLCVGSFNWLSAARAGQYARHETTVVYSGGSAVAKEIESIKQGLGYPAHRIIQDTA